MYSDSGVVTRMCGGVRIIARALGCGVSPVRTAAVMRGTSMPMRLGARADARASGASRLWWTSCRSALSGET